MKKVYLTIVFALLAVVLVACVDNGDGPGEENNGERIDFSDSFVEATEILVWIDDENGEYMQAVIEEFNKVEPNIIVRHQHMGSVDARERLKTLGLVGLGADVFQFPHDHLSSALLEDLVLALPSTVRTVVEERSHPTARDIATMNGQLYAVPMSIEAVGLYYNRALIAGEVPTTYEALLEEVETWNNTVLQSGLTNAESSLYGLASSSSWHDSYFVQHIYSAFGWTPFGPTLDDPSAVRFEEQTLQNALSWMVNTLKPHVTGTGATDSVSGGANFEGGKIPYIVAGPWNIEAYTNAGLDFGIAPLPSINGNVSKPFAGAMLAAVSKSSRNVEAASKFVEFLTSDIAMSLQYEYKFKLPALKSELMDNVPGVKDDEHMMAIAQQIDNAIPMPTIPEVQYYWGPGEAMLKAVWNSLTPISQAVTQAEESFRTLAGLS